MNNNANLMRNNAFVMLVCYVAGIFIWDFTLVYQLILVIMTIVTLDKYRANFFKMTPFAFSMLWFIIYFLMHTLLRFSVKADRSYDYLLTLGINYIAILCISVILDSEDKIEALMHCVIIIVFFLCIYVIIADHDNLMSGNLGTKLRKPFFKKRYMHNDVPITAGLAIMFLSYFRVKEREINKSGNRKRLLLQIFFVIFIVLTGARKSLIFAGFGLFIYPYIFAGSQRMTKFTSIVIGIVLALLAIYAIMNIPFFYNIIGKRFEGYISGLSGGDFTESSARTRAVMREAIWRLIMKKPLIGYGLNTFATFPGSYGTWSHVNYLEIWQGGGIWPVLIYYAFMVYATIKLRKYMDTPMGGMMFTLSLYLFIHDYLSVSYISRRQNLMLCMINAYLVIQANRELGVNRKSGLVKFIKG